MFSSLNQSLINPNRILFALKDIASTNDATMSQTPNRIREKSSDLAN